MSDSVKKVGPRIGFPVQISHQQLGQTKLESRCHRSRQKPWKLLRNQKVAGRPRRAHWPAGRASLGAGNFCEGASHVSPVLLVPQATSWAQVL